MTYQEGLNLVDKASQKLVEANQMVVDSIMNAFIFTWRWWVAVAILIVPWILWAIFRKKESTARLLYAGFSIMILSAILDTIGVDNGLWVYPVKVIPSPSIGYSFRLSLLPVVVMFFIQYKPNFNPFIKAVLYGGLGAFVGMPILAMIDLYKKINWSYTYSFFILIVLYLVAHWFSRMNTFERIQVNHIEDREREFSLKFMHKKEKVK